VVEKSTNGSKVLRFTNRDIMGALNIRMLCKCDLANEERPKAYKREKLEQLKDQAESSTLPKVEDGTKVCNVTKGC